MSNQIKNIAEGNIIKDKRNPFKLEEKKDEGIKDRVLRVLREEV